MPELSIIILTWNTAKITKKCLLSVEKYLKNKINYEIIVADNGSNDNTEEIFKNLKFVKYLNHKTNYGFSKGNNLAVKHARGKYLLFLNSDIEIIDDSLTKMYNFFKKDSSIAAIGPKFLNSDLTPQASVFPPQTIKNAFMEFFLKIPSYSKYLPTKDIPISVWAISGGAILIRKKTFRQINGWNEKYFFYYEDLDLCRKLRRFGQKIYYFPGAEIIHRHGASGKNLTDLDNQWRRLIPGSKIYHGILKHYLLFLIIWSGQKWQKIKNIFGL